MGPPPPSVLALLALLSLLLSANSAHLRVNAGGSDLKTIGFYADLPQYLTKSNSAKISVDTPVQLSGSWNPIYSTYRYAYAGSLEYKLPVPDGLYKVALMFAETWPPTQKKGARLFNILINDQIRMSNVDVYHRVGPNKPLYLSWSDVPTQDGFITITIARIPDAENPMLSAFTIVGDDPRGIIKPKFVDDDDDDDGAPPVDPKDDASDPTCSTGVFGINKANGQMACCEKECGACGGTNCAARVPGKTCCISSIFKNQPSCDSAPPPCVMSSNPVSSPDPPPAPTSCKQGIFGSTRSGLKACCPTACGKCGGKNCHTFSPGNMCCIQAIVNTKKSCDTNDPPCIPSEGSDPKPDPSPSPDPSPASTSCKQGIFGSTGSGLKACCPTACGKCGGKDCYTFSPGNMCCIQAIVNTKKSCDTNDPPCIPSGGSDPKPVPSPSPVTGGGTPKCDKGIFGWNKVNNQYACCSTACPRCGGADCNKLVPGVTCCISSIIKSGKSCKSHPPPCIPDLNAPPSSPPSPSPSPVVEEPKVCPMSGATPTSFRMNIGGGVLPEAIMGADNDKYISSKSNGNVFAVPSTVISAPDGAEKWDAAYSSHRYTFASVISYSIPVPNGKYNIKIMFAETFFEEEGKRMFDLFLNGVEKETNFDIFARVGKNKGLLLMYNGISPVSGKITISLIKVVENPMISAIMIEGDGAGDLATGGGCDAGDGDGDGEDYNGGFNHRAHSVPGGPYTATDFEKSGKAFVSLDGKQSHSHYSDPGPPPVSGKIVKYKWTWEEDVNGILVTKVNSDKSGKFTAAFPLGSTKVTLEVVDNTGDVAVDSTFVEVKNSAEDGAYCYFYNFGSESHSSVPMGKDLNSKPKPLYADSFDAIHFKNKDDLPSLNFIDKSLGVRCVFFIDVKSSGNQVYTVEHNGPFKLFHVDTLIAESSDSGFTSSTPKNLEAGLHPFQLIYFKPESSWPKLVLTQDSFVLPKTVLQYDLANTLPIIEKLSKSKSAPSGGGNIQIYGSGFRNGVAVKFGDVDAQNLISSDEGTVQVTVPSGSGEVLLTVSTNAGVSNEFPFTYTTDTTLEQPVIFEKKELKNPDGTPFTLTFAAALAYGPDGRLYVGTSKGSLLALTVEKDYTVTTVCRREIGVSRTILGVAFDPTSNGGKMFFTTSTMYWKDYNLMSFEEGWPNGKVESITWSLTHLEDGGGHSCAGLIENVVTGLPVSNHDHGINKLQFTHDGTLLISIGGFTNGGLSIPGKKPVPGDEDDDALGGVGSNPLSAAIVACPPNKVTNIKYDQYDDPEAAKIISGNDCKLYATGIRNSFGMTIHTNGKLYATDNGPNAGFGDFIDDCAKTTITDAKNIPDKLFLIEEGKYHGHPNINRGECGHYPASAVQPLLKNIESATTGIIEYRSNTFGGAMKGNLYMSQFAGQNEGKMGQVKISNLNPKEVDSFAANFLDFSGLSIVEGPRGEIIMARVYKNVTIVAVPTFPTPAVTFILGVHPKQGPSTGGTKVLISGFKFGPTPEATFDGKACTNVVVVDDESFTCVTPSSTKNNLVAVKVLGSTGEAPSYGSDYWYW